MGRPSRLTDAQWETIGKRLLKGDKPADLAREFDISKTAISVRFSKRIETVKNVANQLVEVDRAMEQLNVSEQIAARNLADDLKRISEHLSGAALFGAATAHRLSGIANSKVQEIDDAAPLSDASRAALTDVAALTKMANSASEIPLNLVNANKDMVRDLNKDALPKKDRNWTINMVPAANAS